MDSVADSRRMEIMDADATIALIGIYDAWPGRMLGDGGLRRQALEGKD